MSKKKDAGMTKEEQVEITRKMINRDNIKLDSFNLIQIEMWRGRELEDEFEKRAGVKEFYETGEIKWRSAKTLTKEELAEINERIENRNYMFDELRDFWNSAKQPNGDIVFDLEQADTFLKMFKEKNDNTERLIELWKKCEPIKK